MEKRAKNRGGGGGKLNRSETVTIRLDPKLRYFTELAARKQRRTVSSFIEWAIESALGRIVLWEDEEGREVTLGGRSEALWDVDEPDRFAKLAQNYPELLTHDEQVLWKLIKECPLLWNIPSPGSRLSLNFEDLREHWDVLKQVASGEADKSILPTRPERKPTSRPKDLNDDFDFSPPVEDDDIPF
jgi:hypothetical protein